MGVIRPVERRTGRPVRHRAAVAADPLDDDTSTAARIDFARHETLEGRGPHTAGTAGEPSPVRRMIQESWLRCNAMGVDPARQEAPLQLDSSALDEARQTSALSQAMPVIRSLLTDAAAEAGHVVAVADQTGMLLWVEGDAGLRGRAERMGFAAGASWSERAVGTNAPGTALALGIPVQVFATEHYLEAATPWSCTAVPIRDPASGEVLGVLDLTGNRTVTGAQSLALVRATVMAVESALGSRPDLHDPGSATPQATGQHAREEGWRLELLGRECGLLRRGAQVTELTLRHTELLVLLAMHPHGLTAERLATLLDDRDISPITVRAEINRLRRLLGRSSISSRPYRLSSPLAIDALELHHALRSANSDQALHTYGGPFLTRSESPAILELRSDIEALTGSAAGRTSDAAALRAYIDTEQGRLDWTAHRQLLDVLAHDAPDRALVLTRLARLDTSP